MAEHFPPSRGERNAIIGFKPQYEIAAIKIIHAIREGILESIRLADPEAGRVDDFQIIIPNRIDAFQVKWSEHSSLVTYNDLITPKSEGHPCLIAQLADGWKRLKSNNRDKRVVVHLIMRDHPSPNKTPTIPTSEQKPEQYHFAGFISQVWNNAHISQRESIFSPPIEWKPAWDRFREASALETVTEFNEFVRDCKLEFGYEIPSFEELPTDDRVLLKDQIAIISKKIFDLVADPGASIEYSAKEFLQLLGWPISNQLLNVHDFPIDEGRYKQIEGLDEEFERLINNTEKGYIAIIGTPGSGKSTFLTQILKNRKERVIKYYSFIPDSLEPINLRGETKNFLHDIIIQLEREGFSSGGSISSFDRNVLSKRFYTHLQLLHAEWKKGHKKTIFLIDGLDHIRREQHPEFSLLDDLPLTENIPDGIVFVLGSQTDEIFPSGIKSEVRNCHKIEMRPLNRQAVTEIVIGSSFHINPTPDQISTIFTLSDGHPLALNYILNRISDAQSIDDITNILSHSKRYSGNIEHQYQSYWDEICADSHLFEFLGLIARCKSDIDLGWFETWYERVAIIEIRKKFSHYFKRDGNFWVFFHNSFRIFVLAKTCECGAGESDPLKSIYYHRTLAEQSIKRPDLVTHTWDEIFHRFYAKQYQEVIDLATPEYFRKQFQNFRAIPDIKNDINFALSSAKELKNIVIFSRLILVGSEYEQRENYLEEISYLPLLFRLFKDQRRLCLNHILFGNTLKIKQKKALEISKDLAKISYQDAKQVFNLSEPFDILIALEPIQNFQRYEPDLLYIWADSAPYFRKRAEIIDLIKKCQQKNSHIAHKSFKEGIEEFQKELLYRSAISYINLEQWDDVKVITEELNKYPCFPLESDKFNLYHWSWERCAYHDRQDNAQFFLEKGKALVGDSYLSPESDRFNPQKNILLASGVLQIDKDTSLAKKYLQHVSLSKNVDLVFNTRVFSNPQSIFLEYIKYIKITFCLGEKYRPLEVIPSTGNEKETLLIEFKRNLYTISYISAMGDIHKKMSASQIEELIEPILKFYNKEYNIFHNQTEGTLIRRSSEEFFKFLAYSVIKHGDDAVLALCKLLDTEWATPENERYWSSKIWENFIIILYYQGNNKKWCLDKLSSLELSILRRPNEYCDTYKRVNEYFEYAKSWYKCKNDIKSENCLRKAFRTSFGIGFHKDYQLNSWIKWLDTINKIEPNERIQRTLYFARIVSLLHEYTEKRADFHAAEDLISITFDWSPRRALILTKWFADKEIFSEEHARNLFLFHLLQGESHLPIDEIIPFVDLMLCADEILHIHEQTIKNTINRYITGGGKSLDTIVKYLLDSIERYCEPSQKYQWQLYIAELIVTHGSKPSHFCLNIDELKELVKTNNHSTSGLDEKIPDELLQRPVEPEVLIQKIPELKYRYIWEPIVFDIVSTYSKEQIHKVLNAISNNSDLCVNLSQRLMDLNDFDSAKQAAVKAINECEWGGYGLPSDHGTKVEAIKIIMRIDSDFGRELALKTLFNDLTIKFPYFYTIATHMDGFLPYIVENTDQTKQIWAEIQNYLTQILIEYQLPPEIPDNFLDEIRPDTIESAFVEYQTKF
jgi:hypothetical protein